MPGVRTLRTTLRTLHIMAVAVFYGGHVYGVDAARLEPALYAVLASGGLFVALEVARAPIWLVQLRGVATFVKLGLVASLGAFWEQRLLLLTLALVIGSVVAHMPGRFRYYSLVHREVVGPRDKG